MVCACLSICLSVTHEYLKLNGIDVWLRGNSNKNPGFPIQNLPSDSRLEVRFWLWFRFGVSGLALHPFRQKWAVGLVNGSVGTGISLDTRPALPVLSCTSLYTQLH